VYSEPGVGTTFKCYFPISDARPRISRPMHAPVEVKGTETILLVEDEEPSACLPPPHSSVTATRSSRQMTGCRHGAGCRAPGPIHLLLSTACYRECACRSCCAALSPNG